jgi:hypothetical protein
MKESDIKINDFVKETLIKMFNLQRDSKKSYFQIKVPVLEALKAYEIVYKSPITIGKKEDAEIVAKFEKTVNDGMMEFELYCLQKKIKINRIKLEDALYYEYDARSKKPVKQDKTIKIKLKDNLITFKDLNRLYDCASEFNIRISSVQVKELLEENPDIAFNLFRWGNDTEVGDEFYRAFVEKVSGLNYEKCHEMYKDKFYEQIELMAIAKGYQRQS